MMPGVTIANGGLGKPARPLASATREINGRAPSSEEGLLRMGAASTREACPPGAWEKAQQPGLCYGAGREGASLRHIPPGGRRVRELEAPTWQAGRRETAGGRRAPGRRTGPAEQAVSVLEEEAPGPLPADGAGHALAGPAGRATLPAAGEELRETPWRWPEWKRALPRFTGSLSTTRTSTMGQRQEALLSWRGEEHFPPVTGKAHESSPSLYLWGGGQEELIALAVKEGGPAASAVARGNDPPDKRARRGSSRPASWQRHHPQSSRVSKWGGFVSTRPGPPAPGRPTTSRTWPSSMLAERPDKGTHPARRAGACPAKWVRRLRVSARAVSKVPNPCAQRRGRQEVRILWRFTLVAPA
uniref:Uncharacterized protein n=1 Tax=Sphaerodactylus townsendi TaxID=933632 RepID=A0ACB8G1H9_9SAUR